MIKVTFKKPNKNLVKKQTNHRPFICHTTYRTVTTTTINSTMKQPKQIFLEINANMQPVKVVTLSRDNLDKIEKKMEELVDLINKLEPQPDMYKLLTLERETMIWNIIDLIDHLLLLIYSIDNLKDVTNDLERIRLLLLKGLVYYENKN
jgi:hypothetical protein